LTECTNVTEGHRATTIAALMHSITWQH